MSICPVCGTKFSGTNEPDFCPVCSLRDAATEEMAFAVEQNPSVGFEHDSNRAESASLTGRFENYEVMSDKDGRPVELGRGAMGVTYKAFDVDLRYPVALKVINERYLGDEWARLRFLREARVAARVRHPNVASVFHLGRAGDNYFYAMEFVEGENVEKLIRRSGRLPVNLALEITGQVAAGLVAVHKQKFVHRDIKPSNIMVGWQEGGVVTAKIIDLGLAKSVIEQGSQAAISAPGAFAGTPEFASPEQFAGVQVDIRSDLYSLGATLWVMVSGKPLFRGTAGEVMYQHQHVPLPLERLEGVPQPVVVLLEILLDKDPGRRFQEPAELLKAMPVITSYTEAGRKIARESVQNTAPAPSRPGTRRPRSRWGPKKISLARLPVKGSDVFGREEDVAFLNDAWTNQQINVVTIVAWAGVGKSTLVSHWLGQMAVEHYRSAQFVFGWSFYRQGTSGGTSSADEFLDAALTWFGDRDPRIGTAWEKGERLAKLIAERRTLLILDGLEPLQNPPGVQEGRLHEPCLQALLRDIATYNTGLCVITTRTPVADIAEYEGISALRRELERLSSDAGAKLLRALGVKGPETDLRNATDEFRGHCLALTLLGSYLADAYGGDIRCREEVSNRLAHDVRQGIHARRVMESYQTWFGEGPELSALRLLGLFDRPADERVIRALLRAPAIPGLTDALTHLSPREWRMVVARLRRASLLTGEDPQNPGHLDTHPLVREYFGEQLRVARPDAWKEANQRLYNHYRTHTAQLPDGFREMEPLFLAVICGCNAGLFREALHEVYIPRIQRGEACFAANVLGARGALLSVLGHFFEEGHWGSPVKTGLEGNSLTEEDQLFVLMQAGLYLAATRGFAAPEVRTCYERLESLCHSLERPVLLYSVLISQWRYFLSTDKLSTALEIAERVHALATEQNNPALMVGAYRALAGSHAFLGDFEAGRQYGIRGVEIWRSGGGEYLIVDVSAPVVSCLCHKAMCEWCLGEIAASQATMLEAITLAKELNDLHALAMVLCFAGFLAYFKRDPAEIERVASEAIELSARHNFTLWLYTAWALLGWARSTSGDIIGGIPWITRGIENMRAAGWQLCLPGSLALKAEAFYLADRTTEALEAIKEAEALAEMTEERWWCAELCRLRAVLLTALGANETLIEAAFGEAIKIANKQKSLPLINRAEATYAEYRRQRAGAPGGRGLRLPLS